MHWTEFNPKDKEGRSISTVAGEIAYFINEKLSPKYSMSQIQKFFDEVKSDIWKAEEEIWTEEITPRAEEKAKEIIEENKRILEKLKEII